MAKKMTGSVTRKGNRWRASVPRLADPSRRCEALFETEKQARSWVAAQLRRRGLGREPEAPSRVPASRAKTKGPKPDSFEEVARNWHHERYVEMCHGSADRMVNVLRDMELHLFEPFGSLFDLDFNDGRALIKDWLRVMSGRPALTPGSQLTPGPHPYEDRTVTGILWILRSVIAHGRARGLEIPSYADGESISALKPRGRTKRTAPLVSIAEAAQMAAHMHVIHQLVLWLLRLGGLRISEAYGLKVSSFIVDEDGDGYLLAGSLGGTTMRERDEFDGVTTTRFKKEGKSDAATRLIPLARLLTTLIERIITAYHADEEGLIDPEARLIPTVQSEDGGQAAFRQALREASTEISIGGGDLEDGIRAHDLRKGFATDLAWEAELDELVKRRVLGHRAGTDVFSLVYTLDSRLKKHLSPAAKAIEAELAGVLDDLAVPTAVRPVYAKERDGVDVRTVDERLEDMGWQVAPEEDWINVEEAAGILGMSQASTRRLMGGAIPAVKGRRGWRTTVEDTLRFRDRNEDKWQIRDVAEAAGVSYQRAHRLMEHLCLKPEVDAHDPRMLLLTREDGDHLVAVLNSYRDLWARAVSVGDAASRLNIYPSTVRRLLDGGQLEFDPETDSSGHKFVTLASIEAELARRSGRTRGLRFCRFTELTGIDDEGIKALIRAGMLERYRDDLLASASVKAWAAGYRPELLDTLASTGCLSE